MEDNCDKDGYHRKALADPIDKRLVVHFFWTKPKFMFMSSWLYTILWYIPHSAIHPYLPCGSYIPGIHGFDRIDIRVRTLESWGTSQAGLIYYRYSPSVNIKPAGFMSKVRLGSLAAKNIRFIFSPSIWRLKSIFFTFKGFIIRNFIYKIFLSCQYYFLWKC